VRVTLDQVFGENSKQAAEFERVAFSPRQALDHRRPGETASLKQSALQKGLAEANTLLKSMVEEVQEHWPDDPHDEAAPSPATHPNEAARRMLSLLQDIYDRQGGKSWAIIPEEEYVIHTGLSVNEQRAALKKLVDKGLAQFRGPKFTMATPGIDLALSPARLVAELPLPSDAPSSRDAGLDPTPSASTSRKVFVVHGHDEPMRLAVVNFLRHLDFEPIVLTDQPNQGNTLIEKFEKHSLRVGFAVVLLSPDDVGGEASKPHVLAPRARQNVILELGYFVAKLGRARVCALRPEDLEVPSDIHGIAWIQYDPNGAWKMFVARELHAVGFEFDAQKLMSA